RSRYARTDHPLASSLKDRDAPTSTYSFTVKTLRSHSWTSTLTPVSFISWLTVVGVRGHLRSQMRLGSSRRIPIVSGLRRVMGGRRSMDMSVVVREVWKVMLRRWSAGAPRSGREIGGT